MIVSGSVSVVVVSLFSLFSQLFFFSIRADTIRCAIRPDIDDNQLYFHSAPSSDSSHRDNDTPDDRGHCMFRNSRCITRIVSYSVTPWTRNRNQRIGFRKRVGFKEGLSVFVIVILACMVLPSGASVILVMSGVSAGTCMTDLSDTSRSSFR